MSFKVNTNIPALSAQRGLQINQQDMQKHLAKLASAKRINQASDDAANMAIAERVRTQTNGLDQSSRNVQDGISMVQTAEGGLTAINDNVQRIRELSVQAANGTLTDTDRGLIQTEINQLTEEIDRQAGSVQFNGKQLLNGDFSQANGGVTVQAGANQNETVGVNINQTTTAALGLTGIDVTTQAAAQNSLSQADTAVNMVSDQRANLGAFQNRLESSLTYNGIAKENQVAALSRIEDADIASEMTGLAISQILNQTGMASLAQANINNQSALRLLQ